MSIKLDTNNLKELLPIEIYEILKSFIPALVQLGQEKLKEAYQSTFSRNPIDTGDSQKASYVYANSQLRPYPLIKITFESLQRVPFIFFAEPISPKNPNFKYGRRNTIISARDKLATQLGIS